MSEPYALTTIKGGITRLRTKGAALKDSLYDLVNGYVTASKTTVVRPGSYRRAVLTGTKGLIAFDDSRHVFGVELVDVPYGYTLHILAHPEGPDGNGDPIPLKQIHFAKPIMGFLYVAAEFDPVSGFEPTLGYLFHYWIQIGAVWTADTVYHLGDIVSPSEANGLQYKATRLTNANPSWVPSVSRAVGDVVEPTVYNDFYYTVVDTDGANPVSGPTEPEWPTEEGTRVYEDSLGAFDGIVDVTEQPNPDYTISQSAQIRYMLENP